MGETPNTYGAPSSVRTLPNRLDATVHSESEKTKIETTIAAGLNLDSKVAQKGCSRRRAYVVQPGSAIHLLQVYCRNRM